MTKSELDKALSQYMAPIANDGFSNRVMTAITVEDTGKDLPQVETSKWRVLILALTMGLVSGLFVLRILPQLSDMFSATEISFGFIPSYFILAGIAGFLWMIMDPDGLI